jgi:serine/threonine protein phosphatase PrpC
MTDVVNVEEAAQVCPDCGADTVAGDRYCEECGADLHLVTGGMPAAGEERPEQACVACGAPDIDDDGFCTRCGFSQPEGRDRVELNLAGVAGVSDRGLRHHRNEDAMALRVATDPDDPDAPARLVVVVCDGVSTSDRPDVASKTAADTAADILLAAARAGDDLTEATGAAVAAAITAVTELNDQNGSGNAPACTYVSAVVSGGSITVGWVGDSRAYWLDDTDPVCLTVDDSWAERMVASGARSAAEAFADPRSHALVAWIGADAGETRPQVRTIQPDRPGAVLICSDGLWNYLWEADELAAVALPAALDDPFRVATDLTALALERGGHDNITVVLVPFRHPGSTRSTEA